MTSQTCETGTASPTTGLSGPACRPSTPSPEWTNRWFPTTGDGESNQADPRAIDACRKCPIREACLMGAVARGEDSGLWAGAGEQRRRTLRRARAEGPDRLAEVLEAHWRQLDGVPAAGDRDLLRVFGEGATHGRRVTHAKGCRGDRDVCAGACNLATALDGLPGGKGLLARAEEARGKAS